MPTYDDAPTTLLVPTARPVRHGRTTPPAGGVLVVDADPAARERVAAAISAAGFTVWTAADGEGAIEAALARHPDLLVLDRMLPGCTGIEVTRAVRTHHLLEDMRIVMLSGRSSPAVVDLAYRAGVDRFLAKPVADAELVGHARDVLATPRPFRRWQPAAR